MTCRATIERIQAALDLRADPLEDAEVAVHVRSCTHCASAVRGLAGLSRLANRARPCSLDAEAMTRRVMSLVEAGRSRSVRRRNSVWVPWAAVAGLACVAAAVVLGVQLRLTSSRMDGQRVAAVTGSLSSPESVAAYGESTTDVAAPIVPLGESVIARPVATSSPARDGIRFASEMVAHEDLMEFLRVPEPTTGSARTWPHVRRLAVVCGF